MSKHRMKIILGVGIVLVVGLLIGGLSYHSGVVMSDNAYRSDLKAMQPALQRGATLPEAVSAITGIIEGCEFLPETASSLDGRRHFKLAKNPEKPEELIPVLIIRSPNEQERAWVEAKKGQLSTVKEKGEDVEIAIVAGVELEHKDIAMFFTGLGAGHPAFKLCAQSVGMQRAVNLVGASPQDIAVRLCEIAQSFSGGVPGQPWTLPGKIPELSDAERAAVAQWGETVLELLSQGKPLSEIIDILAREEAPTLLPSLVRVADKGDTPTYAALAETEKGVVPVLITRDILDDMRSQYLRVEERIIPVAVLRELPPEVLPYLAVAPAPEESPIWGAWINVPELKQAYETPEGLRVAAQYAITSYEGTLPLFARQAVTKQALGMLQELKARSGLPFKVEGLEYLTREGREGAFRNWPDFYRGYFSMVEFERPITQQLEHGITTQVTTIYSLRPEKGEVRTAENLAPAMRNPEAVKALGEVPVYYMMRGLFSTPEEAEAAYERGHIRYDITVIPPAMLGPEPTRTKGHYHRPIAVPEIYQPLVGEAWYLLQKPRKGFKAEALEELREIEEVIRVKAKAGEVVVIPPGYGHISINPSPEKPLIMANWIPTAELVSNNAVPYEEYQGGAYHFVWEKGELVPAENELYGKVPAVEEIKQGQPIKSIPLLGLEAGKPIAEVIKSPEQLAVLVRYLHNPTSLEFRAIAPEGLFTPVEKPFVVPPPGPGITPTVPSHVVSIGMGMLYLEGEKPGEVKTKVVEREITTPLEEREIRLVSLPETLGAPEEALPKLIFREPVKEISALREPVEAVSRISEELEAVEVPTLAGRALLVQPQGAFEAAEFGQPLPVEVEPNNQTRLIITDLDTLVVKVGEKPTGEAIYAPTDFAVSIIADLNTLSEIENPDGKRRYYNSVYSNKFSFKEMVSILEQAGIPASLFSTGIHGSGFALADAVQLAVDVVTEVSGISPDVLFRMAAQNNALIPQIAANPNIAGMLVQVIMQPSPDQYISHRKSLIMAIQSLEGRIPQQHLNTLIEAVKGAESIRGTVVEPEEDEYDSRKRMKKIVLEAV